MTTSCWEQRRKCRGIERTWTGTVLVWNRGPTRAVRRTVGVRCAARTTATGTAPIPDTDLRTNFSHKKRYHLASHCKQSVYAFYLSLSNKFEGGCLKKCPAALSTIFKLSEAITFSPVGNFYFYRAYRSCELTHIVLCVNNSIGGVPLEWLSVMLLPVSQCHFLVSMIRFLKKTNTFWK